MAEIKANISGKNISMGNFHHALEKNLNSNIQFNKANIKLRKGLGNI